MQRFELIRSWEDGKRVYRVRDNKMILDPQQLLPDIFVSEVEAREFVDARNQFQEFFPPIPEVKSSEMVMILGLVLLTLVLALATVYLPAYSALVEHSALAKNLNGVVIVLPTLFAVWIRYRKTKPKI